MLKSPYHGGHLEVIVGPMFSGKSEELIRRLTRAVIARQRVAVFKPALDSRYHATHVASHAGRQIGAVAVPGVSAIRDHLAGEGPLLSAPGERLPEVVGIDEAQFFGPDLAPLVLDLAEAGVRVILAGLDLDFRAEPFGCIPELLARAESVEKLTAICTVCGAPATRSQRLIGGMPARFDDPVVLVGAEEAYEARCRVHHEVRGVEGLWP
ncbi:thymidine kinase [Deinococcus hopiensis]|uniref:Thymidine kinase n=1 Tax=Deinococcus hopiensis KR-140 TaxID=695939 RepID=A0A1W1VLR8_9DEIO|nr:thymidine kinase [Deinococcus hopiensis]SMB94312.1 thymidine kinase [Deinococcus hopiensis KR-140]